MATKFQFDGKTIRRPGAYSRILSGRNNPPLDLDYGKLLIIAEENKVMGGSGINGEHSKGKDSIYELRDINELRDFVNQGIWYKCAEHLFKPNKFDNGISKAYIVRPYTTTASTLTLELEEGANGGILTLKTLDEGILANGVVETINAIKYLVAGYAYTIETGERDSTKYLLKFWVSTYRGAAADLYPFDEISKTTARPQLLFKSAEFNNMSELISWANTSRDLSKYFKVTATNIKGTGAVDPTEIAALTGFRVSTGATETAGTSDFNNMLEAIKDLDYNVVMYISGEDIESDANTLKIIDHIETESKFDKFLIVGGSDDNLSESISSAKALNSDKVILVHGGVKKRSKISPTGFRSWSSHIHASYICGRLLGLAPQVPLTQKAIDIDDVISSLSNRDIEDALDSGVITTNFDQDRGLFTVEQGINTLQDNDFTLNENGASHVIQLKRIAAQINKELIINAKRQLLSQPNGVNRNTLPTKVVQDWTKSYLQRKIATPDSDNLILSFSDVTVTRQEDAYFVQYKFEPNSEIRIVFFTGFML